MSVLFNYAVIGEIYKALWVCSIGGMTMTGENRTSGGKTCPGATASAPNPTWTGLELKPVFRYADRRIAARSRMCVFKVAMPYAFLCTQHHHHCRWTSVSGISSGLNTAKCLQFLNCACIALHMNGTYTSKVLLKMLDTDFAVLQHNVFFWPVPVAARSKAWVCGRSPAEILGSNPTGGIDVCLLGVLCVVR